MQCPSCNEEIDDGAVVCPHCEAVVDLNAIDDAPRPSKPAASRRPATKSSGRPVARRTATGSGSAAAVKKPVKKRPAPRPAPDPKDTDEGTGNAAGDWRSRVDPEAWNEMPASQKEAFTPDKAVDAEDFIGGFKQFVAVLNPGDKLAFFGALTVVLSCFFPWKETVTEGEVLGLVGPGLVTFLMAVLVVTFMVVRVNKATKVNELLIWAGQLGAVTLGALWTFATIINSIDRTLARALEGNQEVWVSKPGFGAILAVFALGLTGFGTVLGLKGK
ncbi:MAG: hypothetical protein MUC96_04625 [Myxococcaceae bacterium]|jgi:hypothetical protein|nr:hypothetical protein [Myxococcaceae bacterium]